MSSGAVKSLLGLVRKQGNRKTEWTILRCDGVTIPVELSIAAIELKAKTLLFAVLRDITPWKQAQEVLLHANADLEARVKERTADLLGGEQAITQGDKDTEEVGKGDRKIQKSFAILPNIYNRSEKQTGRMLPARHMTRWASPCRP